MAKSSNGIEIMDTTRPFPADAVLARMGLNAADKADKLPRLRPGDTYQDDDELEAVGEGALTARKNDRNTSATLRYARLHFIRIAPDTEAVATDQGHLKAQMVNAPRQYVDGRELTVETWFERDRLDDTVLDRIEYRCRECHKPWKGDYCACGWRPWTLYMFYISGMPMGLVGIYWCKADKFRKYDPWKKDNTMRTLNQQFSDSNLLARVLVKTCSDPFVERYIIRLKKSPMLKHFQAAIRFSGVQSLSGEMTKALADLAYDVFFAWDFWGSTDKETGKTEFELRFGLAPIPAMANIAKKCRSGKA